MSDTTTDTTWVIQVRDRRTGEPVTTSHPNALYSHNGNAVTYHDVTMALEAAIESERTNPDFRYHVLDLSLLIPVGQEPVAPESVQGERQPQIVAGDEGVAEAIRQHEADLATISVDMAEQARRRGWCSEYEGVLRGINAGLYRPLLTGRDGYDTTPRRDRAARALITPGTIQHPSNAAAWGVWYIQRNGDGGWLTEDGQERHAFPSQDLAQERAAEMRRAHSDCQYHVIPIPMADVNPSDARVVYNGATYTVEGAATQMERMANDLQNVRLQMAATHTNKDAFLQALSDRLYEEDEDLATRVINYLNERQPYEFRIPLNEQEYVVHGAVDVTITMSVPISFTIMATSREQAEEEANDNYGDYVSSDDVGEHLRYNMSGREAYDAWNGDWDGFEVSDVEEA